MRRLLAAALIAATATTLTGTAFAEDCVTTYLMSDDEQFDWVTRNPDGSITVYPDRPVADATREVAGVGWLVDCIV